MSPLVPAFRLTDTQDFWCPCILLKGVSGAGKSKALGSLLDAGYRVMSADLEGKLDVIGAKKPLVQPINSRSDWMELLPILADTRARQDLVQRATDNEWDDIDVVANDSIAEYLWLLNADMRQEHENNANKYARWGDFGEKGVNWLRKLRDLASRTKTEKPIAVISTMPINEPRSDMGYKQEKLDISGNIIPDKINQYFSYVFRLYPELEGDQANWYLQSVGTDGFQCKGPGTHVIPPFVNITEPKTKPDGLTFAEVYTICNHYIKTGNVLTGNDVAIHLPKYKEKK